MKRKQPDSLSRRAMKLLCKALGLILALMVLATAVLNAQLENVRYIDPGADSDVSTLSVLSPVNLGILQANAAEAKIGGPGSGILNILLVGQDRREGESFSRSDSMILCTFHKESSRLTMTSFLRDLYVQIPGHHANRINAAYASGGMPLLKKTLTQNFGIHIDGSVEVDFAQFCGIVDELGGVQIELRPDEASVINQETGSNLTEGLQTLTGDQALAYSRIRKLDQDGDFSRTNRQRKLISALLGDFRELEISELLPLTSRILPLISTDLNKGQILMLAMEVLPSLPQLQVVSQHVPAEGTYTDQIIDGMSVLSADPAAVQKMLQQTLLGKQ